MPSLASQIDQPDVDRTESSTAKCWVFKSLILKHSLNFETKLTNQIIFRWSEEEHDGSVPDLADMSDNTVNYQKITTGV